MKIFQIVAARRRCVAVRTDDFREPNVIRAAFAPLYNTFHEVWRFGQILDERQ